MIRSADHPTRSGAGLVLPYTNTEAMNLHLQEISRHVAPGAHAVLALDGAGWHGAAALEVPSWLTSYTPHVFVSEHQALMTASTFHKLVARAG
jgi:hypothetical protein